MGMDVQVDHGQALCFGFSSVPLLPNVPLGWGTSSRPAECLDRPPRIARKGWLQAFLSPKLDSSFLDHAERP
jgi:hypothetical protein